MGQVAMWVFVAAVLFASGFVWCSASEDCSKKHGVLVKDAAGLPACVPEAR